MKILIFSQLSNIFKNEFSERRILEKNPEYTGRGIFNLSNWEWIIEHVTYTMGIRRTSAQNKLNNFILWRYSCYRFYITASIFFLLAFFMWLVLLYIYFFIFLLFMALFVINTNLLFLVFHGREFQDKCTGRVVYRV